MTRTSSLLLTFCLVCMGDDAMAQQRPEKREPTVEEIWHELDLQKALAQHECSTKLDADDPTIEWKKTDAQRKEGKWVVTRYGTRNLGMVTGVCHVTVKNRKVVSIKTWVK